MQECPFCDIEPGKIVDDNTSMVAIADGYPVTRGHLLIVPKLHKPHYFSLDDYEIMDAHQLIVRQRDKLSENDPTITGFNIGTNCGESAGQTIFHCHIHLIPRRNGDTPKPRGGIRGVIPDKQSYDET